MTLYVYKRQAQNAFNLFNLANPVATMSSSTFGEITSAAGVNRQIQIGLRLTF